MAFCGAFVSNIGEVKVYIIRTSCTLSKMVHFPSEACDVGAMGLGVEW